MVISDTNKGSYFSLEIKLPSTSLVSSEAIAKRVEIEMDLILAKMTASSNIYKFESEDKILYLFSTERRKRKGQLMKLIEEKLTKSNIIDRYIAEALLKPEFLSIIEEMKKKQSLKLLSEPLSFDGYKGEDLKVFENKKDWYQWQKDLYDMLFYKTGGIREANTREIITIYDEEGNSGKSSFFKYLYFNHPNEIGRITYGTASQLRTSLINIGSKPIYIIDLTRTKSTYDKPGDLVSALEDLKNGLVCGAMYGSGSTMLMKPPHIIISANYLFDQGLLSKDRWKILAIKGKHFEDITVKVRLNEMKKTAIKK